MRRSFRKAIWISAAVYAAALLLGFLGDFRLTGFALVALLVPWTMFCVVRAVYLRSRGAHTATAEPYDRESYGFALGGSVASFGSLILIVVLTQVV